MSEKILYNKNKYFYYSNIRPFVSSICVSQDTNGNYSLEYDSSYKFSDYIGTFIGFPGNFDDSGELVLGFDFAYGIIQIKGVKTWTVNDSIVKPFVLEKTNYYNNKGKLKLKPSCTSDTFLINTNNQLEFENNFNAGINCGIFFGEPGICRFFTNSNKYSRNYGLSNAFGKITLNYLGLNNHNNNLYAIYDFQYTVRKGTIEQIDISTYFTENVNFNETWKYNKFIKYDYISYVCWIGILIIILSFLFYLL